MDENPIDQPEPSNPAMADHWREPEATDEPPSGTGSSEEQPRSERTALRRSSRQRVFGGVAGGVAERFDLDANVVRVIFVVLALVYGFGVALYLAMWVLIPRSKDEVVEPAPDAVERRRVRWLRFALPLAFVVLVLVVLAALHHAARWGKGLSLLWLIFLVVLAVVALSAPASRLTFRRLVALSFLAFVSFLILVVGAFLLAVQLTGVPLRGGTGVRAWHPNDESEVQRVYRGAIGESTVNLSDVRFGPGTWNVTVSQAVGQLNVDLPSDVAIDLITHVGIGGVVNTYYVASPSTLPVPRIEPRLVLNLSVGIGQLNLVHPVS